MQYFLVVHGFRIIVLCRLFFLFYSGFELSVVKPKPKQLLWPIATDVNNTTSQSEFEADTCNWRQARENGGKHDWFWFGFPLVEKVARVLLTNHRA